LRGQKVFIGDQVAEGVALIDPDDAQEEIDELVPQPVLFKNHLGVREDEIVVHAFAKNETVEFYYKVLTLFTNVENMF
jgi:hypothetical protein